MKPMDKETTRARPTPTQTFVVKYQLNSDAVSAEVITATPVERSNSPPIISKDTPTAMIPIVEDAVQDGRQGTGLGKRRGHQREEDEEDDRAHQGTDLGTSEQFLERTALGDALIGRRRLCLGLGDGHDDSPCCRAGLRPARPAGC